MLVESAAFTRPAPAVKAGNLLKVDPAMSRSLAVLQNPTGQPKASRPLAVRYAS